MQKHIRWLAVMTAVVAIVVASVGSADAQLPPEPELSLPEGKVSYFARDGEISYFLVELKDVPPGFDVSNGNYPGWCLQKDNPIPGNWYEARLWDTRANLSGIVAQSSTGTDSTKKHTQYPLSEGQQEKLASVLNQIEPGKLFNYLNWILNNRSVYGKRDVQDAIWGIFNGATEITPGAVALIQQAAEHGDYLPSWGEIVAVFLDDGHPTYQDVVIEIRLPKLGLLSGKKTIEGFGPGKGWEIRCRNKDTGQEWSTITAADGTYRFEDLTPGEYEVWEVKNSYCVLPKAGVYPSVTVRSAKETTGIDFVNRFRLYLPIISKTGKGDIVGYKTDSRDDPVSGWLIRLKNRQGKVIRTTRTDPTGYYKFQDVVEGTYTVEEEMRDGWRALTARVVSGVTVRPNKKTRVDFQNERLGRIWGYKYRDSTSEPLEGWNIRLVDLDSAEVVQETETDSDGFYEFKEVKPGHYRVEEEDRDGWNQISPAGGAVNIKLDPGAEERIDFRNEEERKLVGFRGSFWFYTYDPPADSPGSMVQKLVEQPADEDWVGKVALAEFNGDEELLQDHIESINARLTADTAGCLILDKDGNIVETVLWTSQWDNRYWQFHEFDLELQKYAGKTVQLYFWVYNNGHGCWSRWYIDDVSLEALFSDGSREQLVKDPSFEGHSPAWKLGTLARYSSDNPHSGWWHMAIGLDWGMTNREVYSSFRQEIQLPAQ